MTGFRPYIKIFASQWMTTCSSFFKCFEPNYGIGEKVDVILKQLFKLRRFGANPFITTTYISVFA